MRGRSTLIALALAALAACGGDGDPEAAPTTTPPATSPATTSPPPTSGVPSAAVVRLTLMEAAIAQEAYSVDAGTYTTDVATLAENGFDGEPGVEVTVVSANREKYCMKAVGGGTTVYYSSESGQPSETPCS